MLAQMSTTQQEAKAEDKLAWFLQVGDVVQDRDMLGDVHPYLVVGRSSYNGGTITMQALSSHEASYYETVATIKPSEKSGTTKWVGCTSYLCGTSDLGSTIVDMPEMSQVPVFTKAYDIQGQEVYVITSYQLRLNKYRVIGQVLSDKMQEILG